MNYSILLLLLLPAYGLAQLNQPANYTTAETTSIYSTHVEDTITISVQLPKDYNANADVQYPIAVLLDGDFYFPTMGPIVRQYEMTGLLPPMILVGIGYGDFRTMDSLRVRDFLYPEPLETDEMTAPGGGLDFYHFITKELLPQLETNFRVDTLQRSLLGHSFGAYFSLFALLQQVNEGNIVFTNIMSASPTLWYHDFYLNLLPNKLNKLALKKPLTITMTAGSLESSEWTLNPIHDLTNAFKQENIPNLYLNAIIFNFLDHMDTGQLSFIKSLQNTIR